MSSGIEEAAPTEPADQVPGAEVAAFRDLLASSWVGYAIHAAAMLNVADALAGGPRSVATVAGAVGADPVALERLLRALVTIGMVGQTDGGYELTPLGSLRLVRRAAGGTGEVRRCHG